MRARVCVCVCVCMYDLVSIKSVSNTFVLLLLCVCIRIWSIPQWKQYKFDYTGSETTEKDHPHEITPDLR